MGFNFSDVKANVEPADPVRMKKEKELAAHIAERELAHLNGLKNFYFLRIKWSWSIFGFITFLIFFQSILTVLVGCGVLNFEKYPWFVSIFVTENCGQIIGLAIIVVKFLFDKKDNAAQF